MKRQKGELSVNASFTAALLTIVRYSCPKVYNRSCTGLLKPSSLGEGCVCVAVCVFALCKVHQNPRLQYHHGLL